MPTTLFSMQIKTSYDAATVRTRPSGRTSSTKTSYTAALALLHSDLHHDRLTITSIDRTDPAALYSVTARNDDGLHAVATIACERRDGTPASL